MLKPDLLRKHIIHAGNEYRGIQRESVFVCIISSTNDADIFTIPDSTSPRRGGSSRCFPAKSPWRRSVISHTLK